MHGNLHQAYGAVQFGRIVRHTCFGLHCTEQARALLRECVVQQASEAAFLLRHDSTVQLQQCSVDSCSSVFLAGEGAGRALTVQASSMKRVERLWFDEDRTDNVYWDEQNVVDVVENLAIIEMEACENEDAHDEEIELEDYRATNVF